jgi:hypothetical protein
MNPSSVVDPAMKLVVTAGKVLNNQRPSKKVSKGDKYMNHARDELEQYGHVIPAKEAKELWRVHEE